MKLSHSTLYLLCLPIAACGTAPIAPSDKHLQQAAVTPSNNVDIPLGNKRTIPLPAPKPSAKVETYSVVVNNVPAQDILFALARDAKVNLDISSGIQGNVTINAINQTLPQILERISKQVDMRYELDNGTLEVMPDRPFLRTYKIDFINIARTAKSSNATSSQISGASGGTGGAGASVGNASSTLVTSETKNDLMESLVKNVTDILLEEDRLRQKTQKETQNASRVQAQGDGAAATYSGAPGGKGKQSGGGESGPAAGASGAGNEAVQAAGSAKTVVAEFEKSVSVFANKETGVLIVRATSRQHEKVQEFIDKVMSSAKRQVLIEATIVEVKLNDQYQQGINWSRALLGAQGFALSQAASTGIAGTAGALTVSYLDPNSNYGNILASVNLLEKFGNVKVLSSPKLSVMNNQTASLKVADSKVYFTLQSTYTPATATTPGTYLVTSTANSVSVGLTMSVTPQISDSDTVTINLRPSISRIISYTQDPNPNLANPCGTGVGTCNIPGIVNLIPEIQTREMESIIKVESGQTAVMGGLIQESIDKNSNEVPFLARIPLLGQLFQNRNDTTSKTELVIFLRPIVIKDASTNGDYKGYTSNLPNADFFHEDARGESSEH
jgi:general secretion pathway protein D